jgi:TM2 domain-containing membrane protein YozV
MAAKKATKKTVKKARKTTTKKSATTKKNTRKKVAKTSKKSAKKAPTKKTSTSKRPAKKATSQKAKPKTVVTKTTNTTAHPQAHKSRIAAGVFAIVLGGLGIHKFYLGKVGWGILYILFCWTAIPSIIGFIEGILYLTATDEEFYDKYA